MKDLTNLPENELLKQVLADEYFYVERHHLIYLKALVAEEFIYNQSQLSHLMDNITEAVR